MTVVLAPGSHLSRFAEAFHTALLSPSKSFFIKILLYYIDLGEKCQGLDW